MFILSYSICYISHNNDYYPFGSLVPNRHGSSTAYRYGFQGQEKDDELKGEGNSLNYTFRMHDPRIGRFFAIDPLTKKYPHYTPYSFSGNKVISFVELEGLEEGFIVGSNRQTEIVSKFNKNIPKDKQNWVATKYKSMEQTLIDIQTHKSLGNKVKTLLIQAHAGLGHMVAFPDHSNPTGGPSDGNDVLSLNNIENYMSEMKDINSIKDPIEQNERREYFNSKQSNKNIDAILAVINEMEDGGTVILNGCHVFASEPGDDIGSDFCNALIGITKLMTGKTMNFIGAQDFVDDIVPEYTVKNGPTVFGGGFIKTIDEQDGYMQNSISTGKDLKLNATTDKPPFEFTPLTKDEKK